jgi:hypothetical protein
MFVQVIKGHTSDPAALRDQFERWNADLRPDAIGFEGATAGIADDGTFIALARFADAAAAQSNSDRPEQGEWWEATAKLLDGEPSFRESTDTTVLFEGPSNEAGFVQVMEGTVLDRGKVEAFETPEMLDRLRATRPDLLGGHRIWFGDGTYVDAAYFTSEAAAREGESSAEFNEDATAYGELFGETTWTDLRDPLLS